MYKQETYCYFVVNTVKDLNKCIIPHFIKYPLITQKLANFLLFKQIINKMSENTFNFKRIRINS